MEEVSNVAVLITHSPAPSSSTPSALGSLSQSRTRQDGEGGTSQGFQQKQAADSLIQVIEKLSKIVEKRPQRRCTLAGQKRAPSAGGGVEEEGMRGSRGGSPFRKMKRGCKGQPSAEEEVQLDGGCAALSLPVPGDGNNNSLASVAGDSDSGVHKRTVTCYQCSLCPFLSQTLPLLKEHLKQHNEQHSDLILMCSECRFTSRDQGQLEAHVRLHIDTVKEEVLETQDGDWSSVGSVATEAIGSSLDGSRELPQKKKWYSYEEYGLYRCLICSYVCSQQRMLKTHAWKHAGLVDCSYPIFEDEDGSAARREAPTAANAPATTREDLVVLSPVLQEKSLQKLPTAFKLQLCVPMAAESKRDAPSRPVSDLSGRLKMEEEEYPIKDLTSEEPVIEVQVTTEAESEVETDSPHHGTSITDSLLSSAQKIINSGPNGAGHINVIVERLPSAEDAVMATNPMHLGPDVDRDKNLGGAEEVEERARARAAEGETEAVDIEPSVVTGSPRDENIPPAGRTRTHSESLRLHSLAAEVLVAMPMRTSELPPSSTKVSLKTITAQAQSPSSCQRLVEAGQRVSDTETTAALLDLELHGEGREEDLGSLCLGEGDEEGPATKAGISLSLLTVIERLRERSDQNASDEDILKELQDNAQFQNGAVVAANGAGGYMCGIPGMDGLVASDADGGGGLIDYIPGIERPYRCRLCRYSSGNKGYIKQHLRVHRQRQPYQCPICEHISSDSKDLETHMIHHCKTRMYQCKQCPNAFHYKSQLRSHERERHSFNGDTVALTPVTETASMVEEAERVTDEECGLQKMYKCDVCDYTSSTYVGVRNHRRIHNSDKPYRCCSCDFATTNMNSLKSHMRRHPQEHQAVQLLEQYRCSLCGYVCSHPPSLKSHMWKHAGDQNYNYEQVNKAINEAISQSSRAPQKLSAVLESVAEPPAVAPPSKDKSQASVEPLATTTPGIAADSSAAMLTDHAHWPGGSPSSQGKEPPQPQSQSRTGHAALGPGMEYCVLLFCCCICGFESTSKERLMEHMKEHEGDIISIILNKEQQQQQQAEAQTAE
ncbi:zinc finger protein 507 [Cyclopterus lumpus]|uniref:Zinc finger protein 507 n=1 Tax=Cyclopterus lumpus TaxID=8103 RepID=A0A8C2YXW0_CYCLU|nr:zinc finger protein 507 [Cyclopterus lumpus]XP_034418292.1 zinc finger protein 507 [Cyclopterus lumpus]